MAEDMRTLGYLCPKCGAPVMGARSVFALEASDAEIECPCGGSVLHTLRRLRGNPRGRVPAGANAPWGNGSQLSGQRAVLLLCGG